MDRLLVFNCSNDMALACGAGEYVPPKQIREMERAMAFVPRVIAGKEDVVVSMDDLDCRDGYRLLADSPLPCPWGWSLAMKNKFRRFGVPEKMLPSDESLDVLRQLSSREFAVEYGHLLYQDMPFALINGCVDYSMRKVSSRVDFDIMQKASGSDVILKSFWSSSGRGNRIVYKDKPENVGTVKFPCVADVFYDKVLDFAMEFEVGDNSADFLGLSVFEASREGRYEKNYVESQVSLAVRIADAFGGCRDDVLFMLDALRDCHLRVLGREVAGRYVGPVGIDMMVVRGGDGTCLFHPCVELNFRMNMGILALLVYERYGSSVESISLDTLKRLV